MMIKSYERCMHPVCDAEKCFGRQWLKNAYNDVNKIGFPEEVELIRKINSKVIAAIDTPVGYPNEITLHNIVKQRTIMGPILRIVETDKISKIWEGVILHMDQKSE